MLKAVRGHLRTFLRKPQVKSNRIEFRADYTSLGMAVRNKNIDFLSEPNFDEAWERVSQFNEGRWPTATPDIRWKAHIAVWAAAHGLTIPGDFVECGVNTGMLSSFVCQLLKFDEIDKRFFLFDTYSGIPTDRLSDEQKKEAEQINDKLYHLDAYEVASEVFEPYPNAKLIKGKLPGSLNDVELGRISYLSIDLNTPEPEIECIEKLWPHLSPSAFVLLDDYGHVHHREQYIEWNKFAERNCVPICTLPTGQGLIIKPA